MYNFREMVEDELVRQKELLHIGTKNLNGGPKGVLKFRKRKQSKVLCLCFKQDNHFREVNVTCDAQILQKIIKKKLAREISQKARRNIKALSRLLEEYGENEPEVIIDNLSEVYKEAIRVSGFSNARTWAAQQSKQFNFDPEVHIHDTISGVKVRSKSEVIIANALTSYGIPFYYEKPFPYKDENGHTFYPDFTIELPFGGMIIWEHLGLLNKLDYCQHNAEKLYLYQKHDYMIGQNFLITQDDRLGGCNSLYINDLIKQKILPHFS